MKLYEASGRGLLNNTSNLNPNAASFDRGFVRLLRSARASPYKHVTGVLAIPRPCRRVSLEINLSYD